MTTRRIGETVVTRVEEALRPGFEPQQLLADWDPALLDEHRDWLVPNYYDPPTGRFMSSIHSWVIRTKHHTILVDTCVGNHKNRPHFERFHMLNTPYLDRLAAAGVRPEEVDYVMCTHLHVDHVGWNTQLVDGRWVPTFPNAKYVFSRVDREYWDPKRNASLAPVNAGVFEDSVSPVIEAGQDQLVEMNDRLGDNFVIEPAPGHTPGHVIFRLLDGGQEGVFVGDVMHHPLQVYRPAMSSRFCTDPMQAAESRKRVLEHCAECAGKVFPAHFGVPHVGWVRRKGDGFRFEFDHGEQA